MPNRAYAGTFKADVYIIYDGQPETDPLILEDAVEITVAPVAWLNSGDDANTNFGMLGIGDTYTLETELKNWGTDFLNIDNITYANVPAGVTVTVEPALPWPPISPGQHFPIQLSVTATPTFEGYIWPPMEVVFVTNACYRQGWDRIAVSGTVTAAAPIFTVPGSTVADADPDAGDNIIVWSDNRNGDADIYAYDLLLNTEKQITTNSSDQIGRAHV